MSKFIAPVSNFHFQQSVSLTREEECQVYCWWLHRQISIELLASAEFKAFIGCAGGIVDESKTEYLKLLPQVCEVITKRSSVRCVGRSLALTFNDSVLAGEFLSDALGKIEKITTYVNKHTKVLSQLVELQCETFRQDRVSVFEQEFHTRWYSKLMALEKYVLLDPFLLNVLPWDGPSLLPASDDNCISDCIRILREVRRVGRAAEADRNVSTSRVPRLLSELDDRPPFTRIYPRRNC